MCRFVLYQGPPLTLKSLVVDPVNSVIHQSHRANEGDDPLNGDGFGIAWYVPELSPDPAVFRSFTPAWSNQNLLGLSRLTRSGHVMAHVRAATPGLPVSELDCHPFTSGPYAFMHNGELGGYPEIRRALLARLSDRAFGVLRGNTDSEHVFALVLDRMWSSTATDPAERMAQGLLAGINDALEVARAAGIDEPSYLNIAMTDGRVSAALRATTGTPSDASSLYLHTGRRYVCDGNICRMVNPENGQGAVLVCSEPLSDDVGWQTVPVNHMVVIRPDQTVDVRAVSVGAAAVAAE